MSIENLDFLKRLAIGLSRHFGSNCEVAIHDLQGIDSDSTIVSIENGHITGRKIGDGPSHVVLEALQSGQKHREDHLDYLTKTRDGRILKSSSIYIEDKHGKITGVFSINFDITALVMAENSLRAITTPTATSEESAEYIPMNVNDLLDELIEESVKFIGKPVVMMTKDEKTRAIQFLNQKGAFLIKKSGDKVSKFFGISKYTLYNYLGMEE